MPLLVILAFIFTVCLAVEAFVTEAVSLRIARIVKFACGAVFTFTLLA